jgi:multicomponent Na+:H+ antiporter subunit D
LPNAYTFAPAEVSAFLAATATKVSYYVLARFLFLIFGVGLAFDRLHFDRVLLPMAVVAMFVGSLVAIFQTDLKRLLAYSSLSQVGYMVLGLALANRSSVTGGIVHLFNHALMKSGLFLVLAAVLLRLGATRLEDVRGLGRQMPWTMAAFVVGGLSLIGVPLTAGFVSKWYLVQGALESGRPLVAALILISSLLAVVYVWRVVEEIYFQPAPEGRQVAEAPLSLLLPIWVLIGGALIFGIFGSATADVARQAADLLLQGPPVGPSLGGTP